MPLQRGDKFTAIWCYPWDLLAEGTDASLGRIAGLGLKGISLAVSYHAGMLLLPHNPQHKVRFLEDGALYFRPHFGYFNDLAIQPRMSALTVEQDPLEAICRAAERHGLEVVAWTVCCHNTYQGERHLDKVLRNAFGDPYPFALCPANPDVQDYLQSLLQELAAYPLRALQLESYDYMGFYHGAHHEKVLMPLGPVAAALMGLCFCPACQREAEADGLDVAAIRQATREYLERALAGYAPQPAHASPEALIEAVPGLQPYLALRERIVARLVRRLVGAVNVPLSLLGVTHRTLRESGGVLDEVTFCAYHRTPEEVTASALNARALVGPEQRLAIGLEANPHLTPNAQNLADKVRAAWQAGAEGLYFYNYGLMPLASLEWLGLAHQQAL